METMTAKEAKYRYLFVVTYGRSGSTLLQGVLNSIPGYVIRGENGGIFYRLHEICALATVVNREFGADATAKTHPWYGIDKVSRPKLIAELRRLFIDNFLTPAPDTRCVGFKEIRYGPDVVQDLPAHLDFMDFVFPKAAFVFNSRNLADTARSNWWRDHPDALGFLTEYEGRMRDVFDRGRDNYFWLKYDDYVDNPDALAPLFEFLDEPFDRTAVESVLKLDYGLARETYRS